MRNSVIKLTLRNSMDSKVQLTPSLSLPYPTPRGSGSGSGTGTAKRFFFYLLRGPTEGLGPHSIKMHSDIKYHYPSPSGSLWLFPSAAAPQRSSPNLPHPPTPLTPSLPLLFPAKQPPLSPPRLSFKERKVAGGRARKRRESLLGGKDDGGSIIYINK